MDDFNNKRQKLLSLKEKIMCMPSNAIKVSMIDGYAQLLGYYKEVCGLTEEETKEYDIEEEYTHKYDQRITRKTNEKIKEITELSPYIHKKYTELINEYKKNGFCSYEFWLYHRVNPDKFYELIADFFGFLGNDVGKLYNKIILNNNIFILEGFECAGVSMNALYIDNPCIIVNKLENYLSFYFTIAHEMGHCYQFYLQRNHTHLEAFNPFMETTSLLFEKLFYAYLKETHEFNNELFDFELENNIYFLNDLSSTKVICELLMNNDVNNVDLYNLSYDCSIPIHELHRKMINDCGYIMPNKLDFALSEFHYSIGEIIACYFMNKMNNDFKNTWKEYKDFITTVDNYPLEEILDKYMDIDLMKENIKTFTKNYHNR